MGVIKHLMETSFEMEIVYIGTNRPKAKLLNIINTCTSIEWKTQSWEVERISKFWRRLMYLYHKRITYSKVGPLEDAIMKDLMTITTYDYSEDGWAIMFGGSSEERIICSGQQLIQCLTKFESWGSDIHEPADFIKALNDHLRGSHIEKHCTSLIVPATATNTHVAPSCLVCGRSMEKNFLFKCCI